MDINKRIGQRITNLRKNKKKILEKLTYESGILKVGLSEIERGKREARV
jgi:transcriptional regulator with XRE-family HTH domain